MKKPEFRWVSAVHRARLVDPEQFGISAETGRFECFSLQFDEHVGRAVFELGRQRVDADSLSLDREGVVRAAKAWLLSRGGTSLNLETFGARTVAADPLAVSGLDTAPSTEVRRIISLAPSNLDVCEALGVLDRVVGCEDSSPLPEGAVRLGPDLAPDLDRVAELEPDLVLASLTVPGMERTVVGLEARGLPHLVLAPRNLADVRSDMLRVATAMNMVPAGQAAVARFDAEVEALEAVKSDGAPARVYLEWWPRPMFTPGRACFSNELIALAGGTNVFGDRDGSSFEVSAEDLLAVDPDVCFVSWCGVDESKLDPGRLVAREGLQSLRAVRSGAVFALDERFSGRPGPRMLEAARRMAAVIRDLPMR